MRGGEDGQVDLLRADCSSCVGLCCVALPFARSADFAFDKAGGVPCPNLTSADRCSIHSTLRQRGFAGCTVFDCFGAGQQVSQVTFAGRSWRDGPTTAEAMFGAFAVLRQVHEMRWYVTDALHRDAAAPLAEPVVAMSRLLASWSAADAERLSDLDLAGLRAEVGGLLRQVSRLVRGPDPGPDLSGHDLVGASRSGADLRRTDLRGTLLIGADLRRADLRLSDLLGADLRGADLGGADLRDALFLTGPQLAAARGDGATRIPTSVARPAQWR